MPVGFAGVNAVATCPKRYCRSLYSKSDSASITLCWSLGSDNLDMHASAMSARLVLSCTYVSGLYARMSEFAISTSVHVLHRDKEIFRHTADGVSSRSWRVCREETCVPFNSCWRLVKNSKSVMCFGTYVRGHECQLIKKCKVLHRGTMRRLCIRSMPRTPYACMY